MRNHLSQVLFNFQRGPPPSDLIIQSSLLCDGDWECCLIDNFMLSKFPLASHCAYSEGLNQSVHPHNLISLSFPTEETLDPLDIQIVQIEDSDQTALMRRLI